MLSVILVPARDYRIYLVKIWDLLYLEKHRPQLRAEPSL